MQKPLVIFRWTICRLDDKRHILVLTWNTSDLNLGSGCCGTLTRSVLQDEALMPWILGLLPTESSQMSLSPASYPEYLISWKTLCPRRQPSMQGYKDSSSLPKLQQRPNPPRFCEIRSFQCSSSPPLLCFLYFTSNIVSELLSIKLHELWSFYSLCPRESELWHLFPEVVWRVNCKMNFLELVNFLVTCGSYAVVRSDKFRCCTSEIECASEVKCTILQTHWKKCIRETEKSVANGNGCFNLKNKIKNRGWLPSN